MADGDQTIQTAMQLGYLLLDAFNATGTGNGVWCDTKGFMSGTIVITGATGAAVVEVDVSNDLARPANNTHGMTQTTLAAGTNGFVSLPALPRWIKARVSTLGTGTVTATANLTTAAHV